MRKLNLCVAGSRHAAVWQPVQMTCEELWGRLRNPARTPETAEQYCQLRLLREAEGKKLRADGPIEIAYTLDGEEKTLALDLSPVGRKGRK